MYDKLTFVLIIYLIYINLYPGYFNYLPSIHVYPNNNNDLCILKQEISTRTLEDISFFNKTNRSVASAFLPYVNDKEDDLNIVLHSQDRIILFFKYLINRRRPYQIDNTIKPLSTKTSQTPAYPAGHAYQALLLAHHLSRKYPEKKNLFDNLAKKCNDCRVKAGIHYNSDGRFSKQLFDIFNK